jgi:DnaK suppressor protein
MVVLASQSLRFDFDVPQGGINLTLYKESGLCYLDPFKIFKKIRTSEGPIMKKKDRENFKKHLTQRLEDLLNQAGDTVSGMTETKENFPDPTDRAALEADRNFMLRIRDREAKLIKKIREALERFENGTYGICESCGEDISIKRLKARPVTTQCIDCKSKEEALEKALGI